MRQIIDRVTGAAAAATGFNPTIYENEAQARDDWERVSREISEQTNGNVALGEYNSDQVAWVVNYPDGSQQAFFNAEKIAAGEELGVVMHELGAHMGIDQVLDEPAREPGAVPPQRGRADGKRYG